MKNSAVKKPIFQEMGLFNCELKKNLAFQEETSKSQP